MGLTLSYKRDIVNIIIAIDDEYAGSLVTVITGISGRYLCPVAMRQSQIGGEMPGFERVSAVPASQISANFPVSREFHRSGNIVEQNQRRAGRNRRGHSRMGLWHGKGSDDMAWCSRFSTRPAGNASV